MTPANFGASTGSVSAAFASVFWCHGDLELLPADRLELARRLVESVVEPAPLTAAVKDGIRRIEEVETGRIAGMTEGQYRAMR